MGTTSPQSEGTVLSVKAGQFSSKLVESEFEHAHVMYLGHVVGHGQVKPVDAKVPVIVEYPAPTTRKKLMRFLGMAVYYWNFCRNFASVCEPLTNLLKKNSVFTWSENCQKAFETIKSLLVSAPFLATPDFDKPFILAVDASDVGVLLQEDSKGVDHLLATSCTNLMQAKGITPLVRRRH